MTTGIKINFAQSRTLIVFSSTTRLYKCHSVGIVLLAVFGRKALGRLILKNIAVIGAGPKAAALCAKAYCVNLAKPQIALRIFERDISAAAWKGGYGYTDGVQRLCTPAERDVGFPYERGLLDTGGVKELFSLFSWHSFLVARGRRLENHRDWVDRGRKPPSHSLYSRYLSWVFKHSEAEITRGEVTELRREKSKWSIAYHSASTNRSYVAKGFDAVVATGPGPAINGFRKPLNSRITDGAAFWIDPQGFLDNAGSSEEPIIIAGSGGTAAAIAAWLVTNDRNERPIVIIGNQAALFTRTESFFENALFSDEDAWSRLAPKDRLGVSQRLNRGVVWASVSNVLSHARHVRFRPGRVTAARMQKGVQGIPAELRVQVQDARGKRGEPASLVVDATGFNAWWFLELLPPHLRRAAEASGPLSEKERRDRLAGAMRPDLSLALGVPGLHAPMLSLFQGPGYASLMVLGAMSDRILRTYADPVL